MNTVVDKRKQVMEQRGTKILVAASEFKLSPVPGVKGASMGTAFIKVTELPQTLDRFMAINPRVPNRNKTGLLSGPVARGILDTLQDEPQSMALKNQGIFILVDQAHYKGGVLTLELTDPGLHGIVNGGHTYAAIREAVSVAEEAGAESLAALGKAYVRVHILQGIEPELVAEIAEGLNRNKQVDDPSLANLQGEFDSIRKVLRGSPAEKQIAYHQGDEGSVYVSEVLVYLSMFDTKRFSELRQPNGLYNRQAMGLRYFKEDLEHNRRALAERIRRLPEILQLVDRIREAIPAASRKAGYKFGLVKVNGERLGGHTQKGMELPFLGTRSEYKVPNGWVYPILAAFRSNLIEGADGALTWRMELDVMLRDLITPLVGVIVAEHKDSAGRPELVGKREAAYAQCFTKAQMYLMRKQLL